MNPKRKAPKPIIDNLEYIGNPFKAAKFDAAIFLDEAVSGADVDLEYVLKFLYSYNGSIATFNSYRRELERLLQWAWRIEKKPICSLKREDVEEFVRFCVNPPRAWIGTKQLSKFKNKEGERIVNIEWRPYIVSVSKTEFKNGKEVESKDYVLSQSALKGIFTTLSSFYQYLCQENITESNPVALIRQKSKFIRKDQAQPIVRRISNLQWGYTITTCEQLAEEYPEEHERTLFIMMCLLAMYLRISELVADERSSPKMSDFRKDHDGNWWFHVIGKGNKSRTITVCNDMIKALKRYRKHLNLPVFPTPDEQIPLIPKLKGLGAVTSTRQIRRVVQDCFDKAYDQMKKDGLEDDASDLKAATVHWLRHTGISEDVKFRPREHVRDDAGHSSMATTDRYVESDLRERHASGKKKRIKEI